MKGLIVILGQARGAHLTYENFRRNFYDTADYDLALLVGDKEPLADNPFAELAKHVWTFEEPADARGWEDHLDSFGAGWRLLADIPNVWLGPAAGQDGSGGILWYLRRLALHHLHSCNLFNYDWYVFTRSDYQYLVPHPPLAKLAANRIYVPAGEDYLDGICDRHWIVPLRYAPEVLGLPLDIWEAPRTLHEVMEGRRDWNPEGFLKMQAIRNGIYYRIRRYPNCAFTVCDATTPTRWSTGVTVAGLPYRVKYLGEYESYLRHRDLAASGWAGYDWS